MADDTRISELVTLALRAAGSGIIEVSCRRNIAQVK